MLTPFYHVNHVLAETLDQLKCTQLTPSVVKRATTVCFLKKNVAKVMFINVMCTSHNHVAFKTRNKLAPHLAKLHAVWK